MSGWIREPGSPHSCELPIVKQGDTGGVWRCLCGKLWMYRPGWWFGDFPPTFQRTFSRWHRARWWEKLRWWEYNGS